MTIVAPTRIVEVVDETDRFGFAYGTLPGHPERGEECFLVERRSDGSVIASISVDAVPGSSLTRVLAPVVRLFQDHAVRTYLDGIARAGGAEGASGS